MYRQLQEKKTEFSSLSFTPYRGTAIVPLKCENVSLRIRSGYLLSIYFCAVLSRLSVDPTYCTIVPSLSVTFHTFFFTIRGRLARKLFTLVLFCIFFLRFVFLILHYGIGIANKKNQKKFSGEIFPSIIIWHGICIGGVFLFPTNEGDDPSRAGGGLKTISHLY